MDTGEAISWGCGRFPYGQDLSSDDERTEDHCRDLGDGYHAVLMADSEKDGN